MSDKSNFPYKTLIWALVALIALFLFKSQFENALTNATEINILGVVIKTNDENALRLRDSLVHYKKEVDQTVTDLSAQLSLQEKSLNQLIINNKDLKDKLKTCNIEVNQPSTLIGTDIFKMLKKNSELKNQIDAIKKVEIMAFKK
ncbi:hypothetical protein PK35_14970 [Tamlana nanhaiensis]|uniref:Uncharacterized protein n=1 Tax=Neotamlana nanhaiensis TaxID=1382798 RepID=A0A0D7VXA0_9FLAO|nr:hypothetical protein [Tamlana nanhaiensis]KJD31409.1 hypothetical protein PK35_14970 [Tamlana nanhaiensis]